MKSSEEMLQSVMMRRAQHHMAQKKRKKMYTAVAACACGLCLLVPVGYNLWRGPTGKNPGPEKAEEAKSVTAAVPQSAEPAQPQEAAKEQGNTALYSSVVFNRGTIHAKEEMFICLIREDFVEMTRSEMIAYYGVDYVPEVPADLVLQNNGKSGIFRRHGGTGEVYFDGDKLTYCSEDSARRVVVSVDKDTLPYSFEVIPMEEEAMSEIGGVEIMLGTSHEVEYLGEFFCEDLGITVYSYGLTQEEFLAVVSSIIEKG